MTLSLGNLAYNYKDNAALKAWATGSYKVNGFDAAGEDIDTLFAQLKSNSGFNPYDSLDSYAPGLENTPMGNFANSSTKPGAAYYKLADNEYYAYTSGYNGTVGLDYDGEYLDDYGTTTSNLNDKVDAAMASLGINSMNQDDLTKLYKQLTTEMQGLKEFTLANTEINDIISEINTLKGAGVQKSLETKITSIQNELFDVYKEQITSIFTIGGDAKTRRNDIFIEQDIENVYNNIDDRIKDIIKQNDYKNSAFYKYYVALRTNPKLAFDKSFNASFGDCITIKDDKITADLADYEGIKKGDQQLGPVAVLQKLYGTQELLELYKQYESSINKASSMELALTMAVHNSAEFDYRKVLAAKVLAKLDTEHKLEVSNESSALKTIKRGSSVGPSSANTGISTHKAFDGYYGDINTKATPTSTDPNCLLDPYEIVINGTKYIMGKDENSNGTIDNVAEILGITDTQENPFQSLLQLDSNKDGIVSKDELVGNGIVLKAVDDSGKLTKNSFDLSLIDSIDLKKINALKDGNSVGNFEMTFLNGRTLKGSQTFENQAYFNTLFSKLVDLRPYQKTTTAAATTTTAATSSTTTATATNATTTTNAATTAETATKTTTTTDNISRTNLLNQINNMYSGLIIDDTSNVESILENSCWKTSTILTPAQRIRIIDSIDPMLPVYKIESEINAALASLNN